MIEWLWWASWLLLAYAVGCRNGFGIGEVQGYWRCAKDEHDVLCGTPHPVHHRTPCMIARWEKANAQLIQLNTETGEFKVLDETRGTC